MTSQPFGYLLNTEHRGAMRDKRQIAAETKKVTVLGTRFSHIHYLWKENQPNRKGNKIMEYVGWIVLGIGAFAFLLFGLPYLFSEAMVNKNQSDAGQHNYEEEVARIKQTTEDSGERDYFSEFYAIITENKKLLDELPPERVKEAKWFLSLFQDDGQAEIARELLKRKEHDLYKWNPRDAAKIIDLHYRKEARMWADRYEKFLREGK